MSSQPPINVSFVEMMASKICHDLISPISAVNNGVEFMEDMAPNVPEDIVDLIAFSAKQASAKLQAYRLAYAAGGRDANIKAEDAYKSIQSIVETEGKIVQTWDFNTAFFNGEETVAFPKILTCILLMALEFLPRGGEISVDPDGDTVHIKAKGQGAILREGYGVALSGEINLESLEPKFMKPYMTGLMARHYGYTLNIDTDTDIVQVTVSLS